MNANISGLDTLALADERIRVMLSSLPSVLDGLHSTSAQVRKVVEKLPYLQEDELVAMGEKDNSCPICIVPFLALIAEEEMARAMDSPAHPVEELGVTRLVGDGRCGHVFCRKDLSKWIISGKNTCPLCRQPLFESERSPPPAAAPASLSTTSFPNADTTNSANSNNTAPSTNPNPSEGQQGLEAMFGERFARLQESFESAVARENEGAPARATAPTAGPDADPAPRPATGDTNTDASQATDTGANPATRAQGSGGIGRDLGEGHADDREEDEEDDILARLTASIGPQEIQGLQDLMAQMRGLISRSAMSDFGPNGQTTREERDDDRDQFSGMYS